MYFLIPVYRNNLDVTYQHSHRYTGITSCIKHHSDVPVVYGEFYELDSEEIYEIFLNHFEKEERRITVPIKYGTYEGQTIWPQDEEESVSPPGELQLTGPKVPGLAKDTALSPQRSKPDRTTSCPVFSTPSSGLVVARHPMTKWDYTVLRWRWTLNCAWCLWTTLQYNNSFLPKFPDALHWIGNILKS